MSERIEMSVGQTFTFAATYSPMVLHWNPQAANEIGWSIYFQAEPEPKIIVRGRKPTQAELLKTCAVTPGCPAWFVQVLEIIVATVPVTP